MNTVQMSPATADAVRDELSAIGTGSSRLQRGQRRARAIAVSLGAVALAGATMGAAAVIAAFPGETTVTPLGSIVTTSGTGSGEVDLGPLPDGAGAVVLDITCTNGVGTVSVVTIPTVGTLGEGVSIDCALRSTPVHISDALLPTAGSTAITVTADSGTTWSATAQYASSTTTEWGVNANGQTYGVPNVNGVPDLTAARATNGAVGYISNDELWALVGEGTINVYESDGTTVIGQFPIDDDAL